jgi:hypothetical protein
VVGGLVWLVVVAIGMGALATLLGRRPAEAAAAPA